MIEKTYKVEIDKVQGEIERFEALIEKRDPNLMLQSLLYDYPTEYLRLDRNKDEEIQRIEIVNTLQTKLRSGTTRKNDLEAYMGELTAEVSQLENKIEPLLFRGIYKGKKLKVKEVARETPSILHELSLAMAVRNY